MPANGDREQRIYKRLSINFEKLNALFLLLTEYKARDSKGLLKDLKDVD